MIHINNGDKPHEWVTEEEFKRRFPDINMGKQPDENLTLQKSRIKRRIKLIDLHRSSGISVVDLSRIERGMHTSQEEIDNYIIALQNETHRTKTRD